MVEGSHYGATEGGKRDGVCDTSLCEEHRLSPVFLPSLQSVCSLLLLRGRDQCLLPTGVSHHVSS